MIPSTSTFRMPQMPCMSNRFQSTSSVVQPHTRVSRFTAPTQNMTNLMAQPVFLPKVFFFLKWVQGMTVWKCYGCNRVIQNPPLQRPDDLIVFCRDVREYRDRLSGQLRRSDMPQNIHFHLRKECILMKYPGFSSGVLKVGPEFLSHLHQEHLQQLVVNFGLILSS